MEISIKDALKLWDEYRMPTGVRDHSISVAKVSTLISEEYKEQHLISEEEQLRIIIAAILHDLMKTIDIKRFHDDPEKIVNNKEDIEFWKTKAEQYKNTDHENAAFEELKDKYEEIAILILNHKFEHITKLNSIGQKIIYYSDKRDEFGEILNLGERLLRAAKRYSKLNDTVEKWVKAIEIDNMILDLEKEIFEKINIEPSECNKLNDIKFEDLLNKHNINIDKKV